LALSQLLARKLPDKEGKGESAYFSAVEDESDVYQGRAADASREVLGANGKSDFSVDKDHHSPNHRRVAEEAYIKDNMRKYFI